MAKIKAWIEIGQQEGAQIVCGGKSPADARLRDGYFIEPTILTGVDNRMRVAREEIFGPVLSVIPFKTEAEVIRQANDTPYGLAAGVWTR
ncbi:MAG: aldehyde dehydrogenase family protein, partial [Pyrinomonadaceae bacterium]